MLEEWINVTAIQSSNIIPIFLIGLGFWFFVTIIIGVMAHARRDEIRQRNWFDEDFVDILGFVDKNSQKHKIGFLAYIIKLGIYQVSTFWMFIVIITVIAMVVWSVF
jgi:hypothetical protein